MKVSNAHNGWSRLLNLHCLDKLTVTLECPIVCPLYVWINIICTVKSQNPVSFFLPKSSITHYERKYHSYNHFQVAEAGWLHTGNKNLLFCWAFWESLPRKSRCNDTNQSSILVHSPDQPTLWKFHWLHQFADRSLECLALSPQSLLHSIQPHSPT